MRVLPHPTHCFGNPNQFQHLDAPSIGLGPTDVLMQKERFTQLSADRKNGIKACHRLLENHRYRIASNIAHLFFVELQKIPTVKNNLPRQSSWRLRNQAKNGHGSHRLPASRFPDDSKRLAFFHCETHAIDSSVNPIRGSEMRLQGLHFK